MNNCAKSFHYFHTKLNRNGIRNRHTNSTQLLFIKLERSRRELFAVTTNFTNDHKIARLARSRRVWQMKQTILIKNWKCWIVLDYVIFIRAKLATRELIIPLFSRRIEMATQLDSTFAAKMLGGRIQIRISYLNRMCVWTSEKEVENDMKNNS